MIIDDEFSLPNYKTSILELKIDELRNKLICLNRKIFPNEYDNLSIDYFKKTIELYNFNAYVGSKCRDPKFCLEPSTIYMIDLNSNKLDLIMNFTQHQYSLYIDSETTPLLEPITFSVVINLSNSQLISITARYKNNIIGLDISKFLLNYVEYHYYKCDTAYLVCCKMYVQDYDEYISQLKRMVFDGDVV